VIFSNFLYIQVQEVKASPVLKLEKTNFDAEVETGVVFVKVGYLFVPLLVLHWLCSAGSESRREKMAHKKVKKCWMFALDG
jgi:hypothetical protein